MIEINDDDLLATEPLAPFAGSLATLVKKRHFKRLLEQDGHIREYLVRAIITDSIPMAGELNARASRSADTFLKVNDAPITLTMHVQGSETQIFTLCSDDSGRLSFVDINIVTNFPKIAISLARTKINELLDTISTRLWIPLTISRLELYVKGESEPLVQQLVLPFQGEVSIGPLGGFNVAKDFLPYHALIREAINAASPFYRFLCAFKAFEGVNNLRSRLNKKRKRLVISDPLPPLVEVDIEFLKGIGLDHGFCAGIKNLADFHSRFTEARNRIAHCLLKSAPGEKSQDPLSMADGFAAVEYSIAAGLLLRYTHEELQNLLMYYVKHLSGPDMVGKRVLMPGQEDQFALRVILPSPGRK